MHDVVRSISEGHEFATRSKQLLSLIVRIVADKPIFVTPCTDRQSIITGSWSSTTGQYDSRYECVHASSTGSLLCPMNSNAFSWSHEKWRNVDNSAAKKPGV